MAQAITVDDYFVDRRERYADEYEDEIGQAAAGLVLKVNQLLATYNDMGGTVLVNGRDGDDFRGTLLDSGWRPPTVNAATPGASATSWHMRGRAVDIHDPGGALDAWLLTPEGQFALEQCGLWLEHPDDTPGWAHVQDAPPASGNRVFLA